MSERAIYLRVGSLIIAGLALAVGLVWFLSGREITRGELAESYFRESVQGLEIGAPVKFRGVTLGRVTEMGLVSSEYGTGSPDQIDMETYQLVFVRFLIDRAKIGHGPTAEGAAKLGLRVRLANQGITGLSYLELDFVSPERYPYESVPWTPIAAYIPSMPSTLSQVQDAAQQILDKLSKVDFEALSTSLVGLVQDLRHELSQGDVHQTMQQAATLAGALNTALQAADLPGLTADLRHTSASFRELAEDQDIRRLIAGAEQAFDRLAKASAQLSPLLTSVQATVRRADSSGADLQQALVPLLRDMQSTMQNLRETTEALRRYPAQVLSGPPPRVVDVSR